MTAPLRNTIGISGTCKVRDNNKGMDKGDGSCVNKVGRLCCTDCLNVSGGFGILFLSPMDVNVAEVTANKEVAK